MSGKERKKMILEIEGVSATYEYDILNDYILDYLNLSQGDLKEINFTFKDMPGYYYDEDIAFLGRVTVGGGSLGVELITYTKGTYELQPFLRYDRGHKEGLKVEHLNPKLRIIDNKGKETILPEKSKYNIFGDKMPEVLQIPDKFVNWRVYDPVNPKKEMHGKIIRKFKKKPLNTKRILKE